MIKQIKFTLKSYYTTIAIVAGIAFAVSLFAKIISGELILILNGSERMSGYFYQPIAVALLVCDLIAGILTLYYVRFFMETGSTRRNALYAVILSGIIMLSSQFLILFLLRLAETGLKDDLFAESINMGPLYVILIFLAYFSGMLANSVTTVLRARYSVPLLIVYFAVAAPNLVGLLSKTGTLFMPLMALYALLSGGLAFILYLSKRSIIRGAAI